MDNKELQKKYDEMHKVGSSAWFSDGKEERETILKMGEPWDDLGVLEIGCGEGKLGKMIDDRARNYVGVDYSQAAVRRAVERHPGISIHYLDYRGITQKFSRLVLQGVLEHLDHPFDELKWMIDNLLAEGGDIITSSPCFLNPRGIVWHTLRMLGAVMSKTDIHFLDPYQFEDFCRQYRYKLELRDCDVSWGNGEDMVKDLRQRIPLALRDGNIPYIHEDLTHFLDWLGRYHHENFGATVIYRIQT